MILPDDSPASPAKTRAEGPPSEVPEEDHIPPPPAYPGRSEPVPSPSYGTASPPPGGHSAVAYQPYNVYQNVDIEAQTQAVNARTPLVPSPVQPPPQPTLLIRRGERAPKRFFKAFFIAVLIYFFVGWFIRTTIVSVKWSGGRPSTVVSRSLVFPGVPGRLLYTAGAMANAQRW